MRSTVQATELIQHVGGVELPATGRWDIPPGQPLSVDRSRSPARLARRAHEPDLATFAGALDVADGLPAMQLVLRAGRRADAAIVLDYAGRLSCADRYGRWEFRGPAVVERTRIEELRLGVVYHGVFAHGATPVALLEVRAAVGGRRVRFRIRGEINLQRPARLSHVHRCPTPNLLGLGPVDARPTPR